jgi:hypothetical protein
LSVIPAIGVYGAIRREKGEPFGFPGGLSFVCKAADADLVADVGGSKNQLEPSQLRLCDPYRANRNARTVIRDVGCSLREPLADLIE